MFKQAIRLLSEGNKTPLDERVKIFIGCDPAVPGHVVVWCRRKEVMEQFVQKRKMNWEISPKLVSFYTYNFIKENKRSLRRDGREFIIS